MVFTNNCKTAHLRSRSLNSNSIFSMKNYFKNLVTLSRGKLDKYWWYFQKSVCFHWMSSSWSTSGFEPSYMHWNSSPRIFGTHHCSLHIIRTLRCRYNFTGIPPPNLRVITTLPAISAKPHVQKERCSVGTINLKWAVVRESSRKLLVMWR